MSQFFSISILFLGLARLEAGESMHAGPLAQVLSRCGRAEEIVIDADNTASFTAPAVAIHVNAAILVTRTTACSPTRGVMPGMVEFTVFGSTVAGRQGKCLSVMAEAYTVRCIAAAKVRKLLF